MFTFYFGGRLSSVTPRSLRRLHWILIPGPLNTGLYKSYTMLMDLGSGLTDGNVLARNSQPAWSVVQLVLDVMRNRIALG